VVTVRFGPFALDLEAKRLTRRSRAVHLSNKAFDLLVLLVSARPALVNKAALIEQLWPDTFVVEANLSNLIAEVRAALGDRSREPRFIRTTHGRGYAFCADAKEDSTARSGAAGVAGWIEWGTARFPLSAGEHIIGRDPDAGIRLDTSTVSRRHARIVIGGNRTMLEDFGSKNGTFVGERRVTSPTRLADGDAIRIGSLLLTYRVRAAVGSTDTVVSR
jgi:DNA-binding winged helix-turn-helix (wHTH) protein